MLRNGIRGLRCRSQLVYIRPASGLNEETRRLYRGNFFLVIRQLPYSTRNNNRGLDLALFLNGIPVFTAELKNPMSDQKVRDAIHQFKRGRDSRETLLAYGSCLTLFAVDPDLT